MAVEAYLFDEEIELEIRRWSPQKRLAAEPGQPSISIGRDHVLELWRHRRGRGEFDTLTDPELTAAVDVKVNSHAVIEDPGAAHRARTFVELGV